MYDLYFSPNLFFYFVVFWCHCFCIQMTDDHNAILRLHSHQISREVKTQLFTFISVDGLGSAVVAHCCQRLDWRLKLNLAQLFGHRSPRLTVVANHVSRWFDKNTTQRTTELDIMRSDVEFCGVNYVMLIMWTSSSTQQSLNNPPGYKQIWCDCSLRH